MIAKCWWDKDRREFNAEASVIRFFYNRHKKSPCSWATDSPEVKKYNKDMELIVRTEERTLFRTFSKLFTGRMRFKTRRPIFIFISF